MQMPLIVIRSDIRSLAFANSSVIGEVGPEQFVSLPVSPRGAVYICIEPLYNENGLKFYPVTRRFNFDDGHIVPPICDDVRVIEWPGGVFELILSAGVFPEAHSGVSCAVAKISLDNNRRATLYRDCGLHLVIEHSGEPLYSYAFERDGIASLELIAPGKLLALAKGPLSQALIVDYQNMKTLYEGSGTHFELSGGELVCIRSIGTFKRHEYQERIDASGSVISKKVGHFIQTPRPPENEQEAAVCFVQAVQYDLPEASAMLSGSLSSLGLGKLKEFFGSFERVLAPPCAVSEKTFVGLVGNNRIQAARMFAFDIENKNGSFLITDAAEV